MGATGFMVLLFLVVVTVGLFLALWLGYQSVEHDRQLETGAGGATTPRRRSGLSAPFGKPGSRADVVRRLERHIRSENRMVAAFGAGPSVDRLHGVAPENAVEAAEAGTP